MHTHLAMWLHGQIINLLGNVSILKIPDVDLRHLSLSTKSSVLAERLDGILARSGRKVDGMSVYGPGGRGQRSGLAGQGHIGTVNFVSRLIRQLHLHLAGQLLQREGGEGLLVVDGWTLWDEKVLCYNIILILIKKHISF